MESAKELKRIIDQYRHNAMEGGFLFDKEIGDRLVERTRTTPNLEPWEKVLGNDGTKKARFNFLYDFTQEINAYQKRNNISGVLWDAVNWKGEVIRFPRWVYELSVMPQDRAILTRWKDCTIDKFVDFVSRHNLEFHLVIEAGNDEDPDQPATLFDVYSHAKNYPYEAALLSGGNEKPVHMALETATPGYIELGEVCYHLTQYDLTLLDVDEKWGGESVHFAVKLRRY